MQLQYGQVVGYLPDLLLGAAVSLQIALVAFVLGLGIGLVGASLLTFGPRPVRWLVRAYVDFFTNTPQLVQIFFLFFALPDLGLFLSPYQAVLLGMTLNAGAYLTEIQRAGFQSIQRAEIEAGETLGFSRAQLVWHVVAPHVVKALYPSLSNQFITMTLGTSMAAIFGVEELTGRALNANAISFRSIEIFSMTALLYIGLTIVASALLYGMGRWLFRVRRGHSDMWDQLAAEAPRFFGYYNLVFLGQAALNTLLVSFVGCLVGSAIGFMLATLRLRPVVPLAPVRAIAVIWVETFRRVPFLVLLMCVFFGFQFAGAQTSLAFVSITAVTLRMSALAAENVRAGYEAVNPRQWEAGLVMNMRPLSVLARVILPQAWRVILPPSTIHTVSMIKETALISQVGFLELTFAARMLTQRGFSALICYGTVLVIYFVISWSFMAFGRWLERTLVHEARARDAARAVPVVREVPA